MVAAFSVAVYVVAPPKAFVAVMFTPLMLSAVPSTSRAVFPVAVSAVSAAAVALGSRR